MVHEPEGICRSKTYVLEDERLGRENGKKLRFWIIDVKVGRGMQPRDASPHPIETTPVTSRQALVEI